jgi:hypothetical protein
MSTLDRYTNRSGLALHPSDARRVGRGLSRLEGQTALDVARVDAVAEVQAARAEAVAQVGGRAMQAVAIVTQLEQQLATAVPLAASRLQAIGDMTALATADVVADAAWKLKRC